MAKTPVLFLIFNRPDTSAAVFEAVKNYRPEFLYVAADGPRAENKNEKEICLTLRRDIINKIDWPCEVKTLFREENLGCKKAISSAIDWFFENVDEGIILEDDCLPSDSFFEFCGELLEKYRHDDRIALISGDNFHFGKKFGTSDYFYSIIPHIWGWATWKRVWKNYDVNIAKYPDFKKNGQILKIWKEKKVQKYWLDIFEQVYYNKIDTWDYQLAFMIFSYNLICICPNVNLVSNIGFGKQSTHIVKKNKYISIPTDKLLLPLKHPDEIVVSIDADIRIIKNWYLKKYGLKKFMKKIGIFNFIKKVYQKLNV